MKIPENGIVFYIGSIYAWVILLTKCMQEPGKVFSYGTGITSLVNQPLNNFIFGVLARYSYLFDTYFR